MVLVHGTPRDIYFTPCTTVHDNRALPGPRTEEGSSGHTWSQKQWARLSGNTLQLRFKPYTLQATYGNLWVSWIYLRGRESHPALGAEVPCRPESVGF